MKQKLMMSLALLCAALMVLSLTACGEKENTQPTKTETDIAEAVTEAASDDATAAETEAATEEEKNAASNELVGSWEYESGGFTYTFNEDGSGTYDVAGEPMNFTYEVNGSTLSILYEGTDASMDLEFEISGDTLNVKDSMGNDTIYNRK